MFGSAQGTKITHKPGAFAGKKFIAFLFLSKFALALRAFTDGNLNPMRKNKHKRRITLLRSNLIDRLKKIKKHPNNYHKVIYTALTTRAKSVFKA